jgi:hypothetical protein
MNTLIGIPLKRGSAKNSNVGGAVETVSHENVYLNSSNVLPPVGCPLLIEVGDVMIPAVRTGIIPKKTDDMEYRLQNGNLIAGRHRWTYP